MKRLTFITLILLVIVGRVSAQNTISCPDITAQSGQQALLSVELSNTADITIVGISFTLTLPEGATFQKKTNGKPVYELVESRLDPEDFSIIPEFYSDNKLGVRIYTTSQTAVLQGTEGTIMTFTLDIADDIATGDYDIFLTENKLSIRNGGNSVTSQVMYNYASKLTVTEPDDSRTVLDENSTTMPEASDGPVNVRVIRTISANVWNTIVLPFAMSEAQVKEAFGNDVQLADFTGTDPEYDDNDNCVAITVNFSDVNAIEANHPYIIKVSQPIAEFTVDNVNIVADEDNAKVEFDNGKTGSRRVVYSGIYGTYQAQTVLDENTLFLSGNKFYYSDGSVKMKAFRAFFDFWDDVLSEVQEASNAVKMLFDIDDDATGIEELDNKRWTTEGTYDLCGRKLSNLPQRGVYIVNGKKVIIK